MDGMKVFKKENVILRTNDPAKMKELKMRGFEEIERPRKTEAKAKTKASGQGDNSKAKEGDA